MAENMDDLGKTPGEDSGSEPVPGFPSPSPPKASPVTQNSGEGQADPMVVPGLPEGGT